MLQDMVHPQDQRLSIDEITSPLGTHHILEFCESELFPADTVQNSEVGSSSNCSNYEKHSSYHQIHLSNITVDNEITPPPPTTGTSSTVAAAKNSSNMPIIFDEDHIEKDISAAIDFTTSPSSFSHHHQYINNNSNNNNQESFDISSLNSQLPLGDMATHGYGPERWSTVAPPPPMMAPPVSISYEEECMMRLKSCQPACSLIDNMMVPYLPQFSAESSGGFTGTTGLMLGTHLSHQDLEFQGDNTALFIPDNMHTVFNCSAELQGVSSESQHLYHGGATTTPASSAVASEISSLDDPTFKVGKLSVEERKRKIHRYMKKRNERNFSKKIKYACRKTLADSRPRVRGRFAKNDELGEIERNMGSNHEDEGDDDVGIYSNSMSDHQRTVMVKDEDDLDSSDILAHISGVNSFKCNYPIQSWI